jgi:hypothetical protein
MITSWADDAKIGYRMAFFKIKIYALHRSKYALVG